MLKNIRLINFVGSLVVFFMMAFIYTTLPTGCWLWCDKQFWLGLLMIAIAFVVAYNLIQLVEYRVESKIVRGFIVVFTLVSLLLASDVQGWLYFIKHLYN